ncbi:hypothetical protein QI30_07310 [Kurthia sp. 3B1D]|uniref:Resolvase HTH domain-containing protein n=1 Tax=Candidatus Kurthia intestinigallinarum TaxID=1562256 RepID=A0A433RVQ2_9BACL|nr:helix-turn-helix domain-containing protein [Kurthia sp. 3B1D]RUS57377.1 hypothetical protein QI30_07310 [Kurthia sp. 3B1D]
MDLSIILMGAGILVIIVSLFMSRSKTMDADTEDISVTLYKETSQIKRRLKVIEEELLLEQPTFKVPSSKPTTSGIHQILVSQVLALHKQGYTISQIVERSSLTPQQIEKIIATGGKLL